MERSELDKFALAKSKHPRGWNPRVKVVLYGDPGVGKSALMLRYVYNRFDFESESTIGAAFNTKQVQVADINVKLEIWDTAGSERFNSIHPMYIRGAKVVLLCFAEPVLSIIKSKVANIDKITTDTEIILVATKIDLPDVQNFSEVSKFAEESGYRLFYTSSLSGHGIQELFNRVSISGLHATIIDEEKNPEVEMPLILGAGNKQETKSWCCYSS